MAAKPNQVASLIIPIQGRNLLIPNSCLAEIVPYTTTQTHEGAPEWVVGDVLWRDLTLPCISYEKLIGELDEIPQGKRIAIFNTLTEAYEKRFYGLTISGIPRLVRVIEAEIVEDEAIQNAFEKMRVQVNGEVCIIPNLEAMEKLLSTADL